MDYDYKEAVKDDVKQYIGNEIDFSDYSNREELEERLNNALWSEDSVTGNASGSYTFNTYKAEECLCHNWGLLAEALQEFGYTGNVIDKGAEWCDVIIRCYLLNGAINEALDEMDITDELLESIEEGE